MTWRVRLKILTGTLVVLVVAALATYHVNQTRGTAVSDSAQILGQSYTVGTPYPGLVVDQQVEVGDEVREGDPLFVIDSTALERDLSLGTVSTAGASTDIDDEGDLVVLATADGTVVGLTATEGTFVSAADHLATVQRAGSLYVQAEYTLSAKEYARVPDDAAVSIVLPNTATLSGHVDHVQVTTVAGQAQAVVTVVSDELVQGEQNGLVNAGTPVEARLALRNDGVVTTVSDAVTGYVRGLFG
ncbi:HlyD family efflux transporter periplasmic adaptor subunit [Cellulomonas sp.]|uniref:HlyD family efflux transporter periplasmic adaptor subunit n=1 Tax=Cellulomonas sp. TaxID=40001 RepID=UPI00258E4C78|nr:HlyD family efflux transporter periplasmic adaptor subunit [Cellulomonas sp.]MCR6690197.1 HlyD family efflux transporter periplasmic adaptor subunit [Cellulomonas sp.]